MNRRFDGRDDLGDPELQAKVARDRLMRAWHKRYPEYGLDQNVGYPTPDHIRALRRYGVTPLHRRSFAPVAVAASQRELFDEDAFL